MIFSLYNPVALKLGAERHVYDRKKLMFTDVVELERASGLAFAEWEYQLGRGSLMAQAALLHVLRKKAGTPSDYETMNFAAFDLEVIPLHEDGSEFTADEITEDIDRRINGEKDRPTAAAEDSAAEPPSPEPENTASTSPSSPNGSESARGSGKNSPRGTSSSSKAK